MFYNVVMKLIKKTALVFSSILISYILFEFIVFRNILPVLPPDQYGHIPNEIRPLAQSSKSSALPKNYIAVIGDSFSYGLGDWLWDSFEDYSPEYSYSHLIKKRTGIDVISFGLVAGGNLNFLTTALHQYIDLKNNFLYRIDSPDKILFFFYEGNDLDNNIRFLKHISFDADFTYNNISV